VGELTTLPKVLPPLYFKNTWHANRALPIVSCAFGQPDLPNCFECPSFWTFWNAHGTPRYSLGNFFPTAFPNRGPQLRKHRPYTSRPQDPHHIGFEPIMWFHPWLCTLLLPWGLTCDGIRLLSVTRKFGSQIISLEYGKIEGPAGSWHFFCQPLQGLRRALDWRSSVKMCWAHLGAVIDQLFTGPNSQWEMDYKDRREWYQLVIKKHGALQHCYFQDDLPIDPIAPWHVQWLYLITKMFFSNAWSQDSQSSASRSLENHWTDMPRPVNGLPLFGNPITSGSI
jgi:hypothetical protein